MLNTIHIVGLGMGPGDVGREALRLVHASDVLAGALRHLDIFPDYTGRRLALSGDFDAWVQAVIAVARQFRVVVVASGDPNFYGPAARIIALAGPENVRVHPNVTAIQAAFARLKEPWTDVRVVSLHGRDPQPLFAALKESNRVAVFTDPTNTPGRIAQWLLDRDQNGWRLAVMENLGDPESRVSYRRPHEVINQTFAPLNVVVLWRKTDPEPLTLGTPNHRFVHEAGLITKAEVRAVALARLRLGSSGLTLWDLGAGCGSVGIEATLLLPGGRVLAVERDPARVAQIRENRARFGVANLEIVEGDMPEVLDSLPAPHRVFVGGGGANLGDILGRAARALASEGVIVVSAVRLESQETARRELSGRGFSVETAQVQVSHGESLAGGEYLKAYNPVWLVTGTKPGEEA